MPVYDRVASDLNTAALKDNPHRRAMSASSFTLSSPMKGMPAPPPPTPILGGLANFRSDSNDSAGDHEMNSRSTSAYSQDVPYHFGQQISNGLLPMPLGSMHDYTQYQKKQLEVRLPSDQLQKLISAMTSGTKNESLPGIDMSMPPPPLPQRAVAARGDAAPDRLAPMGVNQFPSMNGHNRRDNSCSDISMHGGCSIFPLCTSEDEQGQIVHSSPALPSSGVKGRKEGSSPTKRELASL